MASDEAFGAKGPDHGEVLSHLIDDINHEEQQLSLSWVVADQAAPLQSLELEGPLLGLGVNLSWVQVQELSLDPAGHLLPKGHGDLPQLIQRVEVFLDSMELRELRQLDAEEGFSLVDQGRLGLDLVELELQLFDPEEGLLDGCQVESEVVEADLLGKPSESEASRSAPPWVGLGDFLILRGRCLGFRV